MLILPPFLITPVSLLLLVGAVWANTEKTIFTGPKTVNIPPTKPSLQDLHIDTLSPDRWAIRTHLEALFPSNSSKRGKATWLVLDGLTEGQRYEVRVCWAATSTDFTLRVHELPAVFGTPALISSLSEHSWSRQEHARVRPIVGTEVDSGSGKPGSTQAAQDRESSVMFLQILAAADYYTTNKTLMSEVPPVLVDIILDPYLLNAVPRSLLPSVAYTTVVTVLSWFLARGIGLWVHKIAKVPTPSQRKKDQ